MVTKDRIAEIVTRVSGRRLTPPQIFTIVSLFLILLLVLGISYSQSSFYGQAIIDRESFVIRDMVKVLILDQMVEQQLTADDLQDYASAPAQQHLERSFAPLKTLSGVTLIKVFNHDKLIIWSTEPNLIGKSVVFHPRDLERSLKGEVRAVFNPGSSTYETAYALPQHASIEFYVPFSASQTPEGPISGSLAIYRSPHALNETIQHGLFRLWMVTGAGGLVLFGALYALFRSVYYRQREAEFQYTKLTTEHERMVQIEKLSALGQMVSEIAHQLNNPLVGVINLAQLAEREAGDPGRVKELLGQVRQAGEHCRAFVQRMLRFNQLAQFKPQRADLWLLVSDTIEFFQQSVTGSHTITVSREDVQVIIDVDPVLIRHAVFNLLHNAVLAKPGGQVTVSLRAEARNGKAGYAIAIEDDGPGIAAEISAKLFTPFFTTRAGGTGLGLSVAQHIAAQLGGVVHASNRSTGGAAFVIWLPATTVNK